MTSGQKKKKKNSKMSEGVKLVREHSLCESDFRYLTLERTQCYTYRVGSFTHEKRSEKENCYKYINNSNNNNNNNNNNNINNNKK